MNFYELFFIFLQFLLVALSGAVIFVLFLIARSKADKYLINVDEKGPLNEKKSGKLPDRILIKRMIVTLRHGCMMRLQHGLTAIRFRHLRHFSIFPLTLKIQRSILLKSCMRFLTKNRAARHIPYTLNSEERLLRL